MQLSNLLPQNIIVQGTAGSMASLARSVVQQKGNPKWDLLRSLSDSAENLKGFLEDSWAGL
jgi:hypothetical protein